MTDNIRVLPPPEPFLDNEEVDEVQVKIVESILAQTKAGKIDGFVIAYTLRDGRFATEHSLGVQVPVLLAAANTIVADLTDILRTECVQIEFDQSDGPVETPPKE